MSLLYTARPGSVSLMLLGRPEASKHRTLNKYCFSDSLILNSQAFMVFKEIWQRKPSNYFWFLFRLHFILHNFEPVQLDYIIMCGVAAAMLQKNLLPLTFRFQCRRHQKGGSERLPVLDTFPSVHMCFSLHPFSCLLHFLWE